MRYRIPLILIPSLLLFVAACTQFAMTPEPMPTAAVVEAPTESIEPTAVATEEPSPQEISTEEVTAPASTPVAVDPAIARTTLTAMLLDSLTISVPVTSSVGIEGAVAFPLESTDGSIYWLAHTIGIRSFEPEQSHLMAIYQPEQDSWTEVARIEFTPNENSDIPAVSPDYLGEDGIYQVQIEPTHIWIAVEGGVGAHSGVYGILSFDGTTLTQQLDGFSASPGAGSVADLNNDGINEVLLDSTDYYVFCYACGVRDIRYSIWHWNGSALVPVTLQPLSEAATESAHALNETLLALAGANLWKDVQEGLMQVPLLSYTEPTLAWNVVYLQTNAEVRQEAAANAGAYPLLDQVFYGDYAAAVEIMNAMGAEALFTPDTPLITDTVANGWEAELADRLNSYATGAIAQQPELAAAYFVRGWGEYIRNYERDAALADVQQAADLDPDNELYQQSLALLTE